MSNDRTSPGTLYMRRSAAADIARRQAIAAQVASGKIFIIQSGGRGQYWNQATLDAAKRGSTIVGYGSVGGQSNPSSRRVPGYRGSAAQFAHLNFKNVNPSLDQYGMQVWSDIVKGGYARTVTLAQFNQAMTIRMEQVRRESNRSTNIAGLTMAAVFFGGAYLAQAAMTTGSAASASTAGVVGTGNAPVAVTQAAGVVGTGAAPVAVTQATFTGTFSAAASAVKGAAVAAEGYAQTAKNVYGAYALTRAYKAGKSAQSQTAARAAAAIQQDNALKAALAQKAAAQASLDKQQNIGTPSPPSWVKLAIVAAPLSLFFM